MSRNFFPHIEESSSQVMPNHSLQIIRLIEEWKERLNKGYLVGVILTNLFKTFEWILHNPQAATGGVL